MAKVKAVSKLNYTVYLVSTHTKTQHAYHTVKQVIVNAEPEDSSTQTRTCFTTE